MKQAIIQTNAINHKTAANGNSWQARNADPHLRSVLREWQDGFDDAAPTAEEAAA